ncbi:WD40/YVTN repeat-like-containing domain [Lasallia pustulata]|uniref:WD40/YVTN repeat-like-containing domain n=1 Tax=Lasallia pustulata TaxID=136370 RepID=A0A1W5CZ11_9LECA|nr:WD40/YVTN repeat-like-containing domain [Lasallia pustulata]
MADNSPVKEWLKRFIRHGGRDSAKSKKEDGAVSSANSSQTNVLHPSKQAAPSTTATPAIQRLTIDASASLSAAVPFTTSDTALHSSPNNTGAKAATEISQRASSDQVADIIEDLTTDCSLWDRAYDILKNEKDKSPNLIAVYEDILSRVLIRAQMKAPPAPNETEDVGEVTNQIPQYDAIARREKLKEITELGLKHMEDKKVSTTLLGHEIVLQDVVANVAGAVKWAEDYIKDAVKDLPYASIVMAGVSLVLPLLKNPTAVEAANQDGLTYVTSQMRYYVAMESLLLPEDMDPDLKADLTERLVDLFKLIIEFQAQSVIRFYRSRTKNFFRGAINYDGWDEKLQDVKNSDAALILKFETAMSGSSLQALRKLDREAEASRRALDSLVIKMQEHIEVSRDQLGVLQKIDQHITDPQTQTCLKDLRTTDPRHDKKRIEETKGGLLADLYRWVLYNDDFQRWRDDGQSPLLWIKGDPGKGKTMLLCGIINELEKSITDTETLSFFFCQATDARINSATAVLRGLIYLLINRQPSLISHVREKYDPAGKQVFEDANAWVALSEIFTSILDDPILQSTYLIIDALDECTTDLSLLLDLVVQKSPAYSRVKWIVSSRNWPSIEKDLYTATQKGRLCLELNEKSVSAAVTIYVQFKVDWLGERNRYNNDTRDAVQRYLSLNANGTFLWVALVCQELANIPGWKAQKKLTAFPPGLDAFYRRMMDQICISDDAELCKSILAVVSVVYRPITLEELASFVDIPDGVSSDYEALAEIIGLCGSFLTLRERTISFVHQSAQDYLVEQASTEIFPNGRTEEQQRIVLRSIEAMDKALQRDVYNLLHPGCSINKVEHPDPDPLAPIRYACVYWVDHLCKIKSSHDEVGLYDNGTIDVFLRKHFLHWLEALSLIKGISEGVLAIAKLIDLLTKISSESQLFRLVQDAHRFILSSRNVIENTPLQAYSSALLFSPVHSLTRELFQDEELDWITTKPAMEADWGACIQTLYGHSDTVWSVAFSHDGTQVVSGSADNTVKIWDAGSGACLKTLEGHSGRVMSVAFSHDGTQIWDAGSGACLKTLEGHSGRVRSVAFSHDGTQVVSGSEDNTVKIWDAGSGACLKTLEGHSGRVMSVAFSHDGTQVVSGSDDNTVKIWDAGSGACLKTLEGHSGRVRSVAFSHDGTQVVSGSDDKTVKIWDAGSGACLKTLEGHSGRVWSVAFSHDGTQVVSGSVDNTVKIWDAGSGACLKTLEGHSGRVRSVAFSHDGTQVVSGSEDNTVKIWDAGSGACLKTLEGHSGRVRSVAFSHDGTQVVSGSEDNTVKIWDAGSGACLKTLEGRSGRVMSVAFSHDGTQVVSGSEDNTVKIWDAGSGACLKTLEGHSSWVWSVAFSHDGTQVVSGSDDKTVKIWDAGSGACLKTLNIDRTVYNVAFDTTSSYILTDTGTTLWDILSISNTALVATALEEPQHHGYGLNADKVWITWNGQNVLWLPLEYRPSCSAIASNTIIIGCPSGRVLTINFSFNKSPLNCSS